MAPKIKYTQSLATFNMHPNDKRVAEIVGQGNISHGMRVALMWAAHFYNLGLREDDDLRFVGLYVSGKEKPPEGG